MLARVLFILSSFIPFEHISFCTFAFGREEEKEKEILKILIQKKRNPIVSFSSERKKIPKFFEITFENHLLGEEMELR